VSEIVHNGSSQGASTLPPDPHEEFQELCALSTTGELAPEEWTRLRDHLAHCAQCRQALSQYERVIATALPALAEEEGADQDGNSSSSAWSMEAAEAALMESLRTEPTPSQGPSESQPKFPVWKHAGRYAMAAALLAGCAIAGYRAGIHQGRRTESSVEPAPSVAPQSPRRLSLAAPGSIPPDAKSSSEERKSATLRNQVRLDQAGLAALKQRQKFLEDELAERSADLDRSLQDRGELEQRLALAQANAQSLQARLGLVDGQRTQDAAEPLALEKQVNDLNAALQEKDKQIAQERELLQHDRDIRNLIGARNLYIAEIYDVAKTGDTQKPFGRVFYTKDKSLVFYGYDLDQQRGVKQTSAFQAWGRRGTDRDHDVSLGLLYQDDSNQKRWVLKFNDARTIARIDAVFVTVEPAGGSAKPSGNPLLFTYLRLDPNHP